MSIHPTINKIKAYFIELTIITIGVLIALIISNVKEKNQARKYHNASIKTIENEVQLNHTLLTSVIEQQNSLLDTVDKYSSENISLEEVIFKANGLQGVSLSNTGLEFYSRNELSLIDFEMMSILLRMNNISELIDMKMDKLMDFVYPNTLVNTEESKKLFYIHLGNVVESEMQFRELCKNFSDTYVNNKPDFKKDTIR